MSKFIKTLTLKRGLVTNATADTIDLLSDTKSVAAERLIGNPTGSSAAVVEIPLGDGLAFSGGALVNTATPGPTGPAGADGRDAGIKYTYSTTTTAADPGSGYLRFNNATLSSATEMYISETDGYGNGIAATLATWDDSTSTVRGTLTLRAAGDPTTFVQFQITGTLTDNGTWDTFTVAYVSGSTAVVDATVFHLEFSRTGQKGDTGATGSISSMTTNRLLGRYSSGTGAPEELQVNSTTGGLSIDSDGYLRPVHRSLAAQARITAVGGSYRPHDSGAATGTIYDNPQPGTDGLLPLWDGTRWLWSRIDANNNSISLSGKAVGTYDIFAYWDSGNSRPAWELAAWGSSTARGVSLVLEQRNGVWVKNGDNTRRWRGSVYVHSTGNTKFTVNCKYIFNAECRLPVFVVFEDATSHTYTTGTVRAWNNDSNNKMEYLLADPFLPEFVHLTSWAGITSNTAGSGAYAGFGDESTSVIKIYGRATCPANGVYYVTSYHGRIEKTGIGVKAMNALEIASGGGPTDTFATLRGELSYLA